MPWGRRKRAGIIHQSDRQIPERTRKSNFRETSPERISHDCLESDNSPRSAVMSTQFDRLKEIFLVALEKESPAERAEFLDEACAGNSVLRARLDALLNADADS